MNHVGYLEPQVRNSFAFLLQVEKSAVCRIQSNSSVIACGHHGGITQVYGIKTGQAIGQYSITNSSV